MSEKSIRPAQATLNELRGGQVMVELAAAIHDAMGACLLHNKKSEVSLTITFKPLGNPGTMDAVDVTAEVETVVPKPKPPSTIFFKDANGNPSRTQDRQGEIPGLSIAGGTQSNTASS